MKEIVNDPDRQLLQDWRDPFSNCSLACAQTAYVD